jgi:outer membrane protein OmpA-like peptidoglycan-associated protein
VNKGGRPCIELDGIFVAAFAASMTLQTACQTLNTQQEKEPVIGAGGGAVVGGVIGKATGSTARGAIIGAVVGGAAGAIIGHQMDQKGEGDPSDRRRRRSHAVGEGLVVTFASGLLFDTDSSRLRAESKKNLDNLASSLSNFGDSKLLLVGHTDSQGTDEYNLALSRRRADAVGAYLESRGSEQHARSDERARRDGAGGRRTTPTRADSRIGASKPPSYASDKMKADAKALAEKP